MQLHGLTLGRLRPERQASEPSGRHYTRDVLDSARAHTASLARVALSSARRPRRALAALAPARDARGMGSRYPFLAEPLAPRRPGRLALAVSLTDWPYQLKVEGMLLKALELEGYEPALVTARAAANPRRYAPRFGIERLIVLEDYLEPVSDVELDQLNRFLEQEPTVQALKNLEIRGAHIGRQALSSISRVLREGSIDLASPQARALLAEMLPRSLAVLAAAERILADHRPGLVLFNEARYAGHGSFFDAALGQGLNVIQFVSAFSDDALVFKRYTEETRRVHPRSLSNEAWVEVRDGPWTEVMGRELDAQFEARYAGTDMLSRRLHGWTRRRDPAELVRELRLDPSRKTAVVFSHVLWDANLFYGDDLFEDQGKWLVETVREAARTPTVNWVVKLHPSNVWKRRREGVSDELDELRLIRAAVGELPGHVRLLLPESDISPLSVLELADYALTIRGTIGVEAPCFGIPTLTAGTSHYSGRGFTIDSATADEYRERLSRIAETPPLTPAETELARRHAHALFCRRPLHFTSFRSEILPMERSGEPFDHDLIPVAASALELSRAYDLREFAAWATDAGRADYLAPPRP